MLLPIASSALGVPSADLIETLPGWAGPLPSKQYSGYLNSTYDSQFGQLHSHYWFAESENDPATDPVLVWFNGGPGASSLFGFMVELGPFMFNDDSKKTASYNATGVPSPIANPFGWTKVASLLAISGPPPVGFSYCDKGGVAGDGYSCGDWNDTRTAIANADALTSWGKAFPEFAGREMYIAGESYAGIYVPTLVQQLLAMGPKKSGLNLKGFAIGDGCIGHNDMPSAYHLDFHVEFFHGHGQFSDKTYRKVQAACGAPSRAKWSATAAADGSGATRLHVGWGCSKALAQMEKEIGGVRCSRPFPAAPVSPHALRLLARSPVGFAARTQYYSYNLYDECWYENDIGRRLASASASASAVVEEEAWEEAPATPPAPKHLVEVNAEDATVTIRRPEHARLGRAARAAAAHPPRKGGGVGFGVGVGGALNDYVCGGPVVQIEYLNLTAVKRALHVADDAYFFQCDNGVGFNYDADTKALMPFYRHVIEQTDLRVLVYNGDADP